VRGGSASAAVAACRFVSGFPAILHEHIVHCR
jgi:hypothetical protein